MGTPIAGKGHTSPLTGNEKIPLSPDGFATTKEVADLGTGGGGQTLVIANDEDVTVAANPGTTIVLYTALTAPRVVNLPPASSASMTVIVDDANGLVSAVNTITLTPHGADTYSGPNQLIQPNRTALSIPVYISWANDGISGWYELLGAAQEPGRALRQAAAALSTIASLSPPAGGATIDSEARASIAAIISALSAYS